MQADVKAGLVNDAALLHGLVTFVSDFCAEQEASLAYVDQSPVFFRYVDTLKEATLSFLEELPVSMIDEVKPEIYRHKIHLLKGCWLFLHDVAKPIADGHSFATPGPMLMEVERQMTRISADANIVILITPEFNYFQHRLREFKGIVAQLGEALDGAPDIERGIGFISIPYSQSDRVFTNCLIFHELGHFALEELGLEDVVERAAYKVIDAEYNSLGEDPKQWIKDKVQPWLEEMFCDLFAIRLVGPVFSLAFLDLKTLARIDHNRAVEFSESHPADACRFREHMAELVRLNWWAELEHSGSEHIKNIKEFASIDPSSYLCADFDDEKVGEMLLKIFEKTLPELRSLVADKTPNQGVELESFKQLRRQIEDHLSRAIVPSTLFVDATPFHPSPVVVLNAACCFYIESLDDLIEKIADTDPSSVADRSRIIRRLEGWVMKALEDHVLLSQGTQDAGIV